MSSCSQPTNTVVNVLSSSGEYVVLSNSTPYENVLVFTGIVENFIDAGTGTLLKKEFRYSLDMETFSEFQELSVPNLTALGSFDVIYFQFRYILLSGGPITLTNVYLTYTTKPNTSQEIPPSRIEDESKVYAYPVIYKSNFLWEPYKLNRAVRLYKDLNLMVNSLFGHDVHYYRALPHGRSRDVVLMEYSLYEHDQKQCMKVVVPNNEFPDNKLNMGPFGVDFELPFEVQIDKDYYQKIFGEGSGPQKRDVLFFPRTNRIYEVSSSYLYRDFMNEPLYFKVTLIKWVPKSNVEQTDEVNTLESFTASATSLFGEEIIQEQEKITNKQQFSISTTTEDPVRSYIDRDQEINDIKLLNYYTLIAETCYNMDSLMNDKLVKISFPLITFSKDLTYYARYSSDSIQADVQYYYSMKKLQYRGKDIDDKCIFEYSGGISQIQNSFNIQQIFNESSSFNLYETEYTGATGEAVIASCTRDVYSYSNRIVEYKTQNDFPLNADRSYSAWFKLKPNTSQSLSVLSFSFDQYDRAITISYARPFVFLKGDFITLTRTTTSGFVLTGTVLQIISDKSVIIQVDQEILDFVKISFPDWQIYTNLIAKKTYPRVFINGMFGDKGFKIELIENRHVKVTLNDSYKYFSLPSSGSALDDDVWYALFINFSNIFKQMTVNIWKIQWNSSTNLPATTELLMIMNKTIPLQPADRSSCLKFYLEPSFMYLTNIRLFSKIVETDKQTLILNQNIVKDAQWSIIIDNAVKQSRLPYIGYTR